VYAAVCGCGGKRKKAQPDRRKNAVKPCSFYLVVPIDSDFFSLDAIQISKITNKSHPKIYPDFAGRLIMQNSC